MGMLPTASGQTMTGRVGGTVTDPQSAVVPGATVEVVNELTEQTRQVVSGGQGEFVFTNVLAGTYSVRVNAAGFKAYEQKGIQVSANEALALRTIQLELGTTSETVEVTADVARVETQSSERTALITTTQVDNLGISPNRDYLSMLKLIPGVTGGDRGSTILGGQAGQAIVSLDGIVTSDTGVQSTGGWINPTVDAISEMKVMLTNYTADYGARAGGTINVSIKNGTREFHGTAYWFKRHEQFNANSWDNNRKGVAKQKYRFDNPGFTVGGPIIIPGTGFNKDRDKLFFFYSQEWNPRKSPQRGTARFPTELERNGDFSQTFQEDWVTLYAVNDPNTGEQFPGNKIPASRMDAVGKAFLDMFPIPNRTDWVSDPVNTWNNLTTWENTNNRDTEILRVDWNIAPKTQFFARWMRDNTPNKNADGSMTVRIGSGGGWGGAYPFVGSTWTTGGQGLVGTWIQTFTPNLVNEAVVGFNRGYQINDIWQEDVSKATRTTYAGLSGFQQFHPEINPDNIIPSASYGGVIADISVDNRFLFTGINRLMNFNDNLSWVKGTHSLKFGFYSEFTTRPSTRESWMSGRFDFSPDPSSPLESGLGMANAYLGNVRTYQESDSWITSDSHYRDIEFYAQDSWRATRRLTIDIGARFQNISPTFWPGQHAGIFDPTLYDENLAMKYITPYPGGKGKDPYTGEIVAGTFVGTYAIPPGETYTNERMNPFTRVYDEHFLQNPGWLISPRFGFAYDVFGDGKMAVRGGFGMFYDRSGGDDMQANALQVPPVQNMTIIWYSTISDIKTATPTFGPSTERFFQVKGSEIDFNAPGSYNWSFGIQRDLGAGFVLDLSYVGNVGRHRSRSVAINALPYGTRFDTDSINPDTGQVYPDNFLRRYQGYGGINYDKFDSNSNYHSMQMSVNRRFGTRLTINGNWTWSKVMDYSAGGGGPGPPGAGGNVWFLPYESINYGRASTDRPQNVVVNFTYRVPGLSNRLGDNPFVRQVFDGWQVSGIGTFTTGTVQGVSYGLSGGWPPPDLTGSDSAPTRVNLTGNPVRSSRTGLESRLNISAISLPKNGATDCDGTPSNCGLGNAAKDLFYNGGTNNWDITLFKDFYFTQSEQRSLQIRWEMYNAFNHTQLTSVNNSASFQADGTQINPEFGLYNGAAANRIMVFALKFKF